MGATDLDAPIRIRAGSVDLKRCRILRDGIETPLSRLEVALLAYLVERPNQEVSRDELLREVWGHDASSTSRAVDFTVGRLRQKLGEPDPPEQLLTAHGVGYRFVPHDPEPTPISPVPAGPRTLVRTAGGLVDLDRQSFERTDGAVVALGRIEIAILRRLSVTPGRPVALDDLASDVWGRGRHRESATTALSRLRKKLERDPTHPEVLVTTPGRGVRLEGHAAVSGERTNLGSGGSSFVVGADCTALLAILAGHALVTLRGTGGIGKTRLVRQLGALHLEADPRVEVWFCALASIGEAQGIAEAVAGEIGLDPTGQDLVERLGRVLARRPKGSVLILDNYEHLVDCASLVSTWRTAAPDLRIWVTSRIALGLAEEHCVDVEPLDDDAAVRLFVERSHGSAVDSPTIRALVRRLDGLPLAIELAAARAWQITPEVLLGRIGERLDLLVRPTRDNQSHHTTLRGAFDWSWDLLEADERTDLATLSVLVSPFDGLTADALLGSGGAERVAHLADRSLVHREDDGRWRLLESIRSYAAEKLLLSGERDAVVARRAALFLDRAERWVADLDGAEPGAAHRRLRGLRDEILAIYQTAPDGDTAARAALIVAELEALSGHTRLLADLLRGAIAQSPGIPLAWQLWWYLAATCTTHGDTAGATRALARARVLAEAHSVRAATITKRQLALHEAGRGEYASASRGLVEAREAFLAIGEAGWAARTLGNLAYLEVRSATYSGAIEPLLKAVAELRAAGQIRHVPAFLSRAAEVALHVDRPEQASAWLEEALILARACGDRTVELRVLQNQGAVYLSSAAFEAANRRFLELELRLREIGVVKAERAVQGTRASLALERGQYAVAEELLALRSGETESLFVHQLRVANLAVLRLFQGESAEARALLASLDLGWDRGHRYWVYMNSYLAVAAALEGDVAEARERLADVRTRFDRAISGVERFVDLCDVVVELTQALGDPVVAARARGVLAEGVLVRSDDGLLVERPQDTNLVRQLAVRLLGPAHERFETRRYNM